MNKILNVVLILSTMVSLSQAGWDTQQSPTGYSLLSASFLSTSTGWITDGDTLYKTVNGGNTWLSVSGLPYIGGECLYFADNMNGRVTDGQFLARTSNGGINWTNHRVVVQGELIRDVFFLSANTGWASTDIGHIYKTTNGGINWTSQPTNTVSSLNSVFFINNLSGWAVGGSGRILKTTNGGTSWLSQTTFVPYFYNDVYFVSPSVGCIAGYDGVWLTVDGGSNWTIQYNSISSELVSICFASQTTGWAAGENGTIVKTTNSGINWFQQTSNTNNDIRQIIFASTNVGWAVGSNGTVLKTSDGGGPIGVTSISSELPSNFLLSQNYPNPFNPSTNIEFSLPKSGNVKLTIFDALGKEVADIVNDKLKAGIYKADWDASAFPSGIYFYKLVTEDFVQTKKMILIK